MPIDKPKMEGLADIPVNPACLDKQALVELPSCPKGSLDNQEGPMPAVSSILLAPSTCKNELISVNVLGSQATSSPPFPRYYNDTSCNDAPIKVEKCLVGHHSIPNIMKPNRDGHQTKLRAALRGHHGDGDEKLFPKPPTPRADLKIGAKDCLPYDRVQTKPEPGDTKAPLVNGRQSVRRSGRGPEFEITPGGVLSMECQKRGFNPEWNGRRTANGMFYCSVNLNGVVIESGRTLFPTVQMAKEVVAYKALAYIRTCPGGSRCKPSTSPHPRDSQETRTIGDRQVSTIGAPKHAHDMGHKAQEEEEKKMTLLSDLQDCMGIEFPKEFSEDSNTAATFLQGVALGARMAQSVGQSSSAQNDSSSASARHPGSCKGNMGQHRPMPRPKITRQERLRRRGDDRRSIRRHNNSQRSRSPDEFRRRAQRDD